MRFIDNDLLAEFKRPGLCEWCKKPCPDGRDPHHLFTRGMGGGTRLDVKINLCSLCRGCHAEGHAGSISRIDLLLIVAQREGTTQDRIEREIYRLIRLDKDGKEPRP